VGESASEADQRDHVGPVSRYEGRVQTAIRVHACSDGEISNVETIYVDVVLALVEVHDIILVSKAAVEDEGVVAANNSTEKGLRIAPHIVDNASTAALGTGNQDIVAARTEIQHLVGVTIEVIRNNAASVCVAAGQGVIAAGDCSRVDKGRVALEVV
jgi:hypothetical protein